MFVQKAVVGDFMPALQDGFHPLRILLDAPCRNEEGLLYAQLAIASHDARNPPLWPVKLTFFIRAWCIEQYPQAVEAILKGGHEIAHHGFLHEHPRELSDDEEAHWLDRGIEVIVRATGQRPRGWRAPLYNF